MKITYCDRCEKDCKPTKANPNEEEVHVEIIARNKTDTEAKVWHRCDFCYGCAKKLKQLLDKQIKQFLKI